MNIYKFICFCKYNYVYLYNYLVVMNVLSTEKRVQIVNLLVEGCSLRAISRIADCSINTVTKLLVDVGKACQKFHDENVINVTCNKVQCDEIWAFCYSKERNTTPEMKAEGKGDVWTWTGIDAETKLIVSYYVGDRGLDSAFEFIQDLSSRVKNRMQLSTDGHKAYLQAVEETFGNDIDYAQIIKVYGKIDGSQQERKYSPAECTSIKKVKVSGSPKEEDISTSYVERQNLTMRMHMRRFTRLTNAFSKKIENHCYAIALHFVYYNFCRIHKTLRVTPAMEAGLTDDIMEIVDIVNLIE